LPVLAEENLPFSYRQGARYRATALQWSVLRWIARLPYQMDIQPWARIYTTTLAKPGTLMFPVARTAEREDKFRWIGPLVANRIACSAKRPS
jgi:polar amino acid transport system substrate-binding protein